MENNSIYYLRGRTGNSTQTYLLNVESFEIVKKVEADPLATANTFTGFASEGYLNLVEFAQVPITSDIPLPENLRSYEVVSFQSDVNPGERTSILVEKNTFQIKIIHLIIAALIVISSYYFFDLRARNKIMKIWSKPI